MPTYGYRCTVCSHEFERFQKISDPAITACETCGEPVKKMVYPVGIQFKGSGFYVNDYAKSSKSKESAKSESTESTESKGNPETATPSAATDTKASTETKSAATPTPAASTTPS